ncbi:MAG: asparagine synthase (glutamine-hydrolyzing) [bacterium]
MCGITGIFDWGQQAPDALETGKDMVAALAHRGPDGRGLYIDDRVTLGHARLSIIDPKGGRQPISNEDGSLWLICNGEIYNYIELRAELEAGGHRFSTNSDVEVLIHLFEDCRENLLERLNGQFAFALWDCRQHKLFLARDHVGICPLYYLHNQYCFAFASEIKALLKIPGIVLKLSRTALKQVFTFWSTLPGQTPFQDVFEIKPGCYLWVESNRVQEHRYWSLPFSAPENGSIRNPLEAIDELTFLLEDAVRLRLRSDVPVGAYLSGGLDSSITTALVKVKNQNRLRTFSIGFEHAKYDESKYQQLVSSHLNTDHSSFTCDNRTIGEVLPEVVWHAEKPLMRTGPAPLFLLSKMVRESGFRVVLTGEGADEFFSGYNIYKETKLRCFNARQPGSRIRPLLFKRLYPYLNVENGRTGTFWQEFFQKNLLDTADPFYSHRIRWLNNAFVLSFVNPEFFGAEADYDPIEDLSAQLNGHCALTQLKPLARAHFLECHIFLGSYLLSSQGDRMLMSHAVEGRFPFLDRRVIELANRLSPATKLKGLNEKWILKQAFSKLLPPEVTHRTKHPYRAPIKDSFSAAQQVLAEYTTERMIDHDGIFTSKKVALLKKKFDQPGATVSEREEMALVAIATTGMLTKLFINEVRPRAADKDATWWVLDKRTKSGEATKG